MILLGQKKDVKVFWIIDGIVYLKKDNSIVYNNTEIDLVGFNILVNSNNIFLINYDNQGFEQTAIVDKSNGVKIRVLKKMLISSIHDNLFLFSSYDHEFNTILGVYDLIDDINLWEEKNEAFFHLFIDKNLIFSKEETIVALNYKSGKIVWEQRLDKNSIKIERTIGVFEDQLLVGLKNNQLISLNVDTGELLWHIKEGVPVDNLRLSEKEGKLYALQLNKYVVIDAANGEVLIHKDVESYLDNYFGYTLFFIRTSKYNNGLIYFVGGKKGVSDTVGVFDVLKEEITWNQKLDIPKGEFIGAGEDKLQFNDKNLYVLDTSHTLHIFEKESN